MNAAVLKSPKPMQELGRYQFSLRRMFIATTAVAAVFGLAVWGGWVHSDAVVYLSIAVVAAVFSSIARRTLLGGCVILRALWLSFVLGGMLFGDHSLEGDRRSLWIFAAFLPVSAMMLRLYTKAGAFSLLVSLLLAEIFAAMAIVYTYGLPTLFQAFASEDRPYAIQHLRSYFPIIEQWLIVTPWLAGIVLGEVLARRRKAKRSSTTIAVRS